MLDIRPSCPLCGCVIADMEAHRQFHDALSVTWQQAFSVSDEEYEQVMGETPAVRDARITAAPGRPADGRGKA